MGLAVQPVRLVPGDDYRSACRCQYKRLCISLITTIIVRGAVDFAFQTVRQDARIKGIAPVLLLGELVIYFVGARGRYLMMCEAHGAGWRLW